MEITKREIIVSIVIICAMLVFGIMIQQSIQTSITNKNIEYETALKISDSETFKYALSTSVGNAFVYGDLIAIDPVSQDEVGGEWLWLEKVEEKHTKHYRTVYYKEDGKTKSRREPYWTWDRVGCDEWHSNYISFLGVTLPYGKITNVNSYHIKTDQQPFSDTRYIWSGSNVRHKGTIYTKLLNSTIETASLHEDKSLDDTFNGMLVSSTFVIIVFWVIWVAITVVAVMLFYTFENKWLE